MAALPVGSTVGILGGGQLGRMIALEARRLGYRTCVLDPDPRAPAAQVADEHVVGSFRDPESVLSVARRVQVATYEFENIDADAVELAEEHVPVYPGSAILRIAQHRVLEKETVSRLGFPVPKFAAIRSLEDLTRALDTMPFPMIMKTATGGYDGKGQVVVHTREEAQAAFAELNAACDVLILEERVDLEQELSVICARKANGEMVCYPAVENRHRHGILDVTLAPAQVPARVAADALEIAKGIAEQLGLVGILAVEMFLSRDGRVMVNELAPRPHNSGHYTLDACPTSQFEQVLRAVCNLPLGDTRMYAPAAMANLLGHLWPAEGVPDFSKVLAVPGVKLHLYGKAQARPGRKMGHLCCVASSVDEALTRVLEARSRLEA